MSSKRSRGDSNRIDIAGDVRGSALAAGPKARAQVNIQSSTLRDARAELETLIGLLEMYGGSIEQRSEIRSEVVAVRDEMARKKPNAALLRAAAKGIVASVGSVQVLASAALSVLDLVRRLT